jgi:glycosyltransferase involved in cell wall biosynthesis
VSWCKKHRIAVFYDHVDWFEPNWHNPFRALVRIINYRILNKKVIPNCDGVICISDYLAEYHRKYHRKTVVVPPLSIETASNCTMVPKNAIQFIYAGTTSDVARPTSQWKDRLDIMFEGLANAQNAPGKRSFIVDVYGMSEEQYIMMFPEKERPHGRNVLVSLKDKVRFHGLVDNKETMKATRRANFSLLIRDVKRSTMVGLPTKVSESISCGTPVICTDTSDLTTYIKNGDNGFICSHESYVDTLKQVLSMTDEQLAAMKMNCSYNPFFFMNYKDRLISFLSEGKNVNI